MTKFSKCASLYAVLFLMICCVVLTGCRKAQQQDGVSGTKTTNMAGNGGFDAGLLDDEDDDLIVEIETNGTGKTSGSTTSRMTQSVVQSTDSAAKSTTQSAAKSTGSTSSKATNSVSSSKDTQQSDTTTTTVRTTQKGWTPDLGKKPK